MRPEVPSAILRNGGCTFAERPEIGFPAARIVWRAELDPETLTAEVIRVAADDGDRIDPEVLRRFLFLTAGADGREHAVLSDGVRRIRLDIACGSLVEPAPFTVRCSVAGIRSAEPKIRPLLRLIDVCRRGCFAAALFPVEPKIDRWIALLRVHDALAEGAGHREIAVALFGLEQVHAARGSVSDSLRSRVRRLVRDARMMAQGRYRTLLLDRQRLRLTRRRQADRRL